MNVCRRLKREVIELREELALLRGADEGEVEITEETMGHLKQRVRVCSFVCMYVCRRPWGI
jgi:hypothetical protein